jgi:hypothetical protein
MSLNSAFSSAAFRNADSKARISGSVSGTVSFSFGGSQPSSKSVSNGSTMNTNLCSTVGFVSSSPAAKRAVLKDIPWSGPNSAGCGGVSIGECLLH